MKKWILSTGLRLNRDSLYGWTLCPQAGIVFQPGSGSLIRAAVGRGFRSPQLNELYMFPPSNPDLKPESVWNYEIGFERAFGARFRLGVAVFEMKGTNLIETGPNPAPPPAFIFLNSGTFTFRGAELTVRADLHRDLSALVFYTFLDPGEKTKGRPGHKFDMSLRFRHERLFAALTGQYITDYYADNGSLGRIPSFFVLNARADIKLFSAFSLFVEMNNLLNTGYSIYADLSGTAAGLYRMPGRAVNVGVRTGL